MSTGENIQYLRKREGYTQEGFAEKMCVSRQTISKWESDACYPEMEKLVSMCELFGCKMDDLIRGDVKADDVSDTAGYDAHMNQHAKNITIGVVLILAGVTALLVTYGLTHVDTAAVLALFPFVIAGVAYFVTAGMQHEHFKRKHPQIVPFYTEEEQDAFQNKFITKIVTGISLILLGVVCLIGMALIIGESYLDQNEFAACLTTSVMMLFVTQGVGFLVYAGIQKSKFNIDEYNRENSPEVEEKETKIDRITGAICACLMIFATLVFVLLGTLMSAWHISWVAYVVAVLLCGVVHVIGDAFEKSDDSPKKEKAE
ncbi:MAG: helix-turn-helix transcriptional regulator [Oscillospiraceae bacterium]|nr:helix-turn-helix transcriptional regulator [Oscillospiraceae bacterium]